MKEIQNPSEVSLPATTFGQMDFFTLHQLDEQLNRIKSTAFTSTTDSLGSLNIHLSDKSPYTDRKSTSIYILPELTINALKQTMPKNTRETAMC
jgi:hypothetical protein